MAKGRKGKDVIIKEWRRLGWVEKSDEENKEKKKVIWYSRLPKSKEPLEADTSQSLSPSKINESSNLQKRMS